MMDPGIEGGVDRIAVVGGGPVGGLLAAALAERAARVVVVDTNPAVVDALKTHGIRVREGDTTRRVALAGAYRDIAALQEEAPDVVVIATKTWTYPLLLPALERTHRRGRRYVVAQNGIDNERVIANSFGAEHTVRMVVNYAGDCPEPGVMRQIFFHPPNRVGVLVPEAAGFARTFARFLSGGGLETEFAADLRTHIWKKAAMNAAMSAVCALTRRDMRGVMSCVGTRTFVRRVLRECAQVANAEGQDFDEDFIQACVEYLIRGGPHKPSMLQDVEAGRPTEVDALNWRITEIGRKLGVPTPLNETLAILVHGVEAQLGQCYGFRIGSVFVDASADQVCGLCPYDHGHTAVRGSRLWSADAAPTSPQE